MDIMTWLPNAGAAGLVIYVVGMFLREQRSVSIDASKNRTIDFDNFKSVLKDFKDEIVVARTSFAVQLNTQRLDFINQLKSVQEVFNSQLNGMTKDSHERHEGLQNQIVDLVKDNNKVGIQMASAITELRDEIRTIKNGRV